jgi:hypothetical protein
VVQGELEVLTGTHTSVDDGSARVVAMDFGTSGAPMSCLPGKEKGEQRRSTSDEATTVVAHRR